MQEIHKSVRITLGYKGETPDSEIIKDWKERTSFICRPCWELHYCPYGPMVEEFPLLPPTKAQVIDHNKYLQGCISTGVLGDGKVLDAERKKWFQKEIDEFNPNDYPEGIPKQLIEASCRVFGHFCPVFFVAEPMTETKEVRKHSRLIPRDVMLKVVRRDGQICQKCNKPVLDNEVEFDHLIPFSKGGRSTVGNLRLVHKDCNRSKSNSLDEILHTAPINHLIDIKKNK